MRTVMTVIAAAVGAMPAIASADQLMCNPREVAEAAASMLPEGAIVLDYCSNCVDRVRVVRVVSAAAVQGCDWELEVAGRVLWESESSFEEGYLPEQASFRRDGGRYLRRLDLAYVYVEVEPNDFRWFGAQLGLPARVKTTGIRLPKALSKLLGRRPAARAPVSPPPPRSPAPPSAEAPPPGPPVPAEPAAEPSAGPAADPAPGAPAQSAPLAAEADVSEGATDLAPSADEATRLFDYWRQGGPKPVLAHFIACLELDLDKRSATRFECIKAVDGPVPPGTQVFAWADWLVPRSAEFNDFAMEFVYGGEVRLRKQLKIRGRVAGPMVPTTAGAKLSQRGLYTLRVVQGSEILKSVDIAVR